MQRINALKPSIILNESIPLLSERKIEIKSVPPVVAPAFRARHIAAPFMMPPKTAIRSISSVSR